MRCRDLQWTFVNVFQSTIEIHIKRPKKWKNGRLTKPNCYKAAVSRPQFKFEIANGGQNEKNRIMRFVATHTLYVLAIHL